MQLIPAQEVSKEEFLNGSHNGPVYTHLDTQDTFKRSSDGGFDKGEFYKDPSGYESAFLPYCHAADVYVACHYWKEGSPYFFTREDMKDPRWKVSVVADVSCDIDGPVACTVEPSTIADPIYGYHIASEKRVDDFRAPGTIAVMAVDNLPCELAAESSTFFSRALRDFVAEFAHVDLTAPDGLAALSAPLRGAIIAQRGELTPRFAYIKECLAADGAPGT